MSGAAAVPGDGSARCADVGNAGWQDIAHLEGGGSLFASTIYRTYQSHIILYVRAAHRPTPLTARERARFPQVSVQTFRTAVAEGGGRLRMTAYSDGCRQPIAGSSPFVSA